MQSSKFNTPLVTVGMVTYNSAPFINEAIESVLSSSYDNFELIIIDDASIDNTWDIIKKYKDPRIISSRNERNLGEYTNRNKIIDKSSGEYLIYIDGDDMIYPHGLEIMTIFLHAFPNSGMALMRWYKKNIFYPIEMSPEQYFKAVFFNYGLDDISFANTFFRVDALRKIGHFPTDFVFGDSYARLKIGAANNVLLISDGLTWWRETIGQASSVHSKNINSIISLYKFRFSLINSSAAPLNQSEKRDAEVNLKREISRYTISFIKSFKFYSAIKIVIQFKISLIDLIGYRRAFITKDPFEIHTPHDPARVKLELNPFSNING